MEHQNESMAVRIPHARIIQYVAIHVQKYKSYGYWWNGGTLREMFNLDNAYGDDIYARVMHPNSSEGDYIKADRLRRFPKKRTELCEQLDRPAIKASQIGPERSVGTPSAFQAWTPRIPQKLHITINRFCGN